MSRRFEPEEISRAYTELKSEQSIVKAMLGAVLGVIPAAVIFHVLVEMEAFFIWMLCLPAIVIGYFSGYLGKIYELKYRLCSGFIALTVHLFGALFILNSHAVALMTLPLSFGIAVYTSRRNSTTYKKRHYDKQNMESYLPKKYAIEEEIGLPLLE